MKRTPHHTTLKPGEDATAHVANLSTPGSVQTVSISLAQP